MWTLLSSPREVAVMLAMITQHVGHIVLYSIIVNTQVNSNPQISGTQEHPDSDHLFEAPQPRSFRCLLPVITIHEARDTIEDEVLALHDYGHQRTSTLHPILVHSQRRYSTRPRTTKSP